ncbi:MAG: methylmalonyl Co-A mutase-associated GTPase MeaB [Actinomycetia bacterium]|nr:methylmalonyl Co-A mutase-associated GTPase MeaB [Actinomycetes bacterium]
MTDALDRRSLGRGLSAATDASVAEVLEARGDDPLLRPHRGHRLGITGPPGVGKSTLVGALAGERLSDGRRIGIIAIDPTSPHSGGSILGDRIRIDAAGDNERLYLRSVPSRLAGDGLTDNLPDLVSALEREPFDEVWVETVGVGQVAYGVRRCVDTLIVLVQPGSGDTVQAMKAGILEVGDVYVVTRADRPGAEHTAAELEATLAFAAASDWRPPVLLTAAPSGDGVGELSEAIDAHRHHLDESGGVDRLGPDQARYDVERLLHRRVRQLVGESDPGAGGATLASVYQSVVKRLAGELPRVELPTEDYEPTDQESQRRGS